MTLQNQAPLRLPSYARRRDLTQQIFHLAAALAADRDAVQAILLRRELQRFIRLLTQIPLQ